MSYQDYQYSWPSEPYQQYSYDPSQYTTAVDSHVQYPSNDQLSSSTSQPHNYQYETSYLKQPSDTLNHSNVYSTDINNTVVDSNQNPSYAQGQGQYSMTSSNYQDQPESSSFQSPPYQYSTTHLGSASTNEITSPYNVNANAYSSSSYQYSSEPPMDTRDTSGQSYGTDMINCNPYPAPVDSGQDNQLHTTSYVSDYAGQAQQYNLDVGPTSLSSSSYYLGLNDDAGRYGGDNRVDSTSSYGSTMPPSNMPDTMIGSSNDYLPSHQYEDNTSSNFMAYDVPSYEPKGQGYDGYTNSSYSTYSHQGERNRQNNNVIPRGGSTDRSAFSSNRGSSGSSSFPSYSNTTDIKTSQSHFDVTRDRFRSGVGSQLSGNRFDSSRSRGSSNIHSSSSRSRGGGSSGGFQRGSTGSRFNSNSRGGHLSSGRGSDSSYRGGQQRGFFPKPLKDSNFSDSKQTPSVPTQNSMPPPPRDGKRQSENVIRSQWKAPESSSVKEKEKLKTPSRPQDKLLNEIEQKEKDELAERDRKAAEEKKKAEMARKSADEARRADEEAQNKIMEDTRKKAEEMARKLAPPGKPPETAEEIAKEEEIQRKIRESVVVVDPVKEMSLLTDDPIRDIDMPKELRELLKSLTSDTLCKLCSLRMVGPHMAPMHYNGKNHLKKVRTFVQTNGRSAGFNMETLATSEEVTTGEEKKESEAETTEEEMDVDEKKYCKICKVSFSHGSQYEMHYKGKNHAKKVRSLATSSEIFECKICCVTVTAQEHLTAHLNGARHKLQLRKNNRDNIRGRGGFYTRPGRGGMGRGENGLKKPGDKNNGFGNQEQSNAAGRGQFNGRGSGRGRGGFKRPTDQNGLGSFGKRARF